jgi:hypothetical protein
MTSLQTSIKQIPNDGGYFITVGALTELVYNYVPGNADEFTVASWAKDGPGGGGQPLSTIKVAGGILKDMGKTVVSSTRTFRKVQLVRKSHSTLSTFGVSGGITAGEQYYTGYIELGFEGNGNAAPVAQFGR